MLSAIITCLSTLVLAEINVYLRIYTTEILSTKCLDLTQTFLWASMNLIIDLKLELVRNSFGLISKLLQ